METRAQHNWSKAVSTLERMAQWLCCFVAVILANDHLAVSSVLLSVAKVLP